MQSFIGCKRGKVRNNADKRLHITSPRNLAATSAPAAEFALLENHAYTANHD